MGDDGTFWGGELLLADLVSYRRLARFGRAPMPGGASAVKRPYRMALGYLLAAEGAPGPWEAAIDAGLADAFLGRLDPREVEVVRLQLGRGLNAPDRIERRAPVRRCQQPPGAPGRGGVRGPGRHRPRERGRPGRARPVCPGASIASTGCRCSTRVPTLLGAAGVAGCRRCPPRPWRPASSERSRRRPGSSSRTRGGPRASTSCACRAACSRMCGWQIRCWTTLARDGFTVHINERVPVNDGGISYGQAAIGAARLGSPAGQIEQKE